MNAFPSCRLCFVSFTRLLLLYILLAVFIGVEMLVRVVLFLSEFDPDIDLKVKVKSSCHTVLL